MNFLAHLYLSGSNQKIAIGNFIADAVRKKQWAQFHPEIIKGIELHHKIDAFTDTHPVVLETKKRLRPAQGKYSPVVADILYDHFLSVHFSRYGGISIEIFAENTYAFLLKNNAILPAAIQRMLPYMIEHNWLVAYGQKEGLQQVFNGMSRRAKFENNMANSVGNLFENYALFEKEFEVFFEELQAYVKTQLINIEA